MLINNKQMKTLLALLSISILASCNTSKDEVGCNCNEVLDKQVTVHEHPYLWWKYELYVDYCNGGKQWVDVSGMGVYDNINRGDCY